MIDVYGAFRVLVIRYLEIQEEVLVELLPSDSAFYLLGEEGSHLLN